jgi:hypothetical protein
MVIKDGFTRKEAMTLTGTSSNQLQYLEREKLVCPNREYCNGQNKARISYTWEQILEIKAISKLAKATSLQTTRKVISFFKDHFRESKLRDKQLVIVGDEVYWIKYDHWSDLGEKLSALKVADKRNKGVGQYTLIIVPALIDIVSEVWEVAESSNQINMKSFQLRAKLKPFRLDDIAS